MNSSQRDRPDRIVFRRGLDLRRDGILMLFVLNESGNLGWESRSWRSEPPRSDLNQNTVAEKISSSTLLGKGMNERGTITLFQNFYL